jgi:outer membrane immunogenic protein
MTNHFLLVSVAGAALAATISSPIARAADLPPPPPPQQVVEIRESIADWTGGYFGGVVGGNCMETTYIPSAGPDPDLNGCGFAGGLVTGVNYQVNRAVIGLEGDWTFGTRTGVNQLDAVKYKIDYQASIRARAGWLATDATLIYATGGVGWMRGTMDALVGPGSVPMSDKKTHFGFVVGGGLEHAFTSNLHGRLEYLYANYNTKRYDLDVPGACGVVACKADLDASSVHSVRVGLTYNFSVGSW